MKTRLYQPGDQQSFDSLVLGNPESLLYVSRAWLDLLSHYLEARVTLFLAWHDGRLRGALPVLSRDGPGGIVANSLPFYGSNGSCIIAGGDGAREEIQIALLAALHEHAREAGWVATTVITSPFETSLEPYEGFRPAFRDSRIGQLTPLDVAASQQVEAELFARYHFKTRNMVRKAAKCGFTIRTDWTEDALNFLADTHEENMRAIGGIPKTREFFTAVQQTLPASMRRLYVAEDDGLPVAAMLILYFNKTAEYYTPVIKSEYRASQPLSLLIHRALQDCVHDGYQWWNWGGTWTSQEGVYRFKSRWGTRDLPYHYFTYAHRDMASLLQLGKTRLLQGYPHMFTVPFAAVEGRSL